MSEIPHEIDARIQKLKERAQSLVGLLETISFLDDPTSGLSALKTIPARLEDLGIILYDCETIGEGYVDLQAKLSVPDVPGDYLEEVENDNG